MIIFPAIDLYAGKAVRLYKGDYQQMTIYSDKPWQFIHDFAAKGASHVHLVDLEGAKEGNTANLETIRRICAAGDVFCELGGGIRSMETIEKYLNLGINRVILGTKAVEEPKFAQAAVEKFGAERIAVGIDLKDAMVAIKGWQEKSRYSGEEFLALMCEYGVQYFICTDISKDGALKGANIELYRSLQAKFPIKLTASGGVSSLEDIAALKELGLYGAIVGKAYYEGKLDLQQALALGGAQ